MFWGLAGSLSIEHKTGNIRKKCNAEALSSNNFCIGKLVSVTYSECVFVELVIQLEMSIDNIVTWSATLYSIL